MDLRSLAVKADGRLEAAASLSVQVLASDSAKTTAYPELGASMQMPGYKLHRTPNRMIEQDDLGQTFEWLGLGLHLTTNDQDHSHGCRPYLPFGSSNTSAASEWWASVVLKTLR